VLSVSPVKSIELSVAGPVPSPLKVKSVPVCFDGVLGSLLSGDDVDPGPPPGLGS
jgi:hypothetical protein